MIEWNTEYFILSPIMNGMEATLITSIQLMYIYEHVSQISPKIGVSIIF